MTPHSPWKGQHSGKDTGLESGPLLTGLETLDKPLHLCIPQFPPLQHGEAGNPGMRVGQRRSRKTVFNMPLPLVRYTEVLGWEEILLLGTTLCLSFASK